MADAPDPKAQSQSPLDKEQRQGLVRASAAVSTARIAFLSPLFSLVSSAPAPAPAAASAMDSGSLLAGNAVLPDHAESFSPAPKSIQSVPPAHHIYPNLQLLCFAE